MTYSPIQPPVVADIRNLPKPKLRMLFSWFIDQIPQRLVQLQDVVNDEIGRSPWKADLTPESLEYLGEWLSRHVATRERADAELETIRRSLLFPVDVSTLAPTEMSVSFGIDVGMYLGEVLRKNFPALRWVLKLGGKGLFDYGRPVIEGFRSGVTMNPVHIALVLVQGFTKGSHSGARLRELYDFWAREGPTV